MLKKLLTLLVIPSIAFACTGPKNLYGIHFNNGEAIDTAVLESLGSPGAHYFKDAQGYSYRSHYSNLAMIQLKHSVLEILVNLPDSQLNTFLFGACLRAELNWMVDKGVLSMDNSKREKIEQSFIALGTASNGLLHGQNHFYWTKQDTLLPGGIIVSNGSFLPVDCYEEAPTFILPPGTLGISLGVLPQTFVLKRTTFKSDRFLVNGRSLSRQAPHFGILIQNGRIGGRR